VSERNSISEDRQHPGTEVFRFRCHHDKTTKIMLTIALPQLQPLVELKEGLASLPVDDRKLECLYLFCLKHLASCIFSTMKTSAS